MRRMLRSSLAILIPRSLRRPRFLQGFTAGFIFVPLQTPMLPTIPMERLGNSTLAYDVAHLLGGSRRVRFRQDARGRRLGEEEEEGARDRGRPAPAA